MLRKKTPTSTDLGATLDDLLGATLAAGWDDAPADTPAPAPEYPPLPVRDDWGVSTTAMRQPQEKVLNQRAAALLTAVAAHDPDDEPTPPSRRLPEMSMGALADIASGRRTVQQTADEVGVPAADIEGALATALKGMDPKDIAKAMGLQAAQEQLKSGALFGLVIHDLVQDMAAGKLAPALKLQLADMLAKIGRVMPREDKSAGVGGGFVLNISMGAGAPQPITIEAQD